MDSKIIAIDGVGLLSGETSLGVYTKGLISGLLSGDGSLPTVYALLFSDDKNKPVTMTHENLQYVYLPQTRKSYLRQASKLGAINSVDKHLGGVNIDLAIYTTGVAWPRLKKAKKQVLLIHDLGYVDVPEYYDEKYLKLLQKLVPKSIKMVDVVTTISKFTARRVREEFGSRKPVMVASPAFDPAKYNPEKIESDSFVNVKYRLPEKFVLSVGSISPRKNVVGLIKAYGSLSQEILAENALVIVGQAADSKAGKKNQREIEAAAQGFNVIQIPRADQEDMASLYRLAEVFVNLSHYEGFGIATLESMACGTPVIVSSAEALKEVTSGAGIVTSNNQPEQAIRALQGLLSAPDMQSEYIEKGLAQASKFTWQKTAEVFMSIINRPD